MEVVGCGGGFGLQVVSLGGSGVCVVVGLFGLVAVGGDSGLQWWLVVAVDCGGW